MRAVLSRTITACALLGALATAASGQGAPYREIGPNYDFPAGFNFSSGKVPTDADFVTGEKLLLKFLTDRNFKELRRHAWEVFAGMTQPTPEGHAVWESWHIAEDVFRGVQPAPAAMPPTGLRRSLEPPRKFGIGVGAPVALAPGQSLAFSVLFNRAGSDHVMKEKLHDRAALDDFLKKHNASGSPVEKRIVPEFPRKAIALKVSWRLVKKDQLRPFPIWDNDLAIPGNAVQPALPELLWKRCVVIDPTGARPEGSTASAQCGFGVQTMPIVHLSRFYHFQVDAAAETVLKQTVGADVAVGDFLVLAGFHYTTKEIPEWVWGTFWWHDKPNDGEFGNDRSPKVTGVWRNYLMDVGYSRDLPQGDDKGPHDVQNPYVEARFPNGIRSNCMTCHARSVLPRLPPEPGAPAFDLCGALPVTRGATDLPPNDPRLGTRLQLDFLWSVLLRSAPSEARLCE